MGKKKLTLIIKPTKIKFENWSWDFDFPTKKKPIDKKNKK